MSEEIDEPGVDEQGVDEPGVDEPEVDDPGDHANPQVPTSSPRNVVALSAVALIAWSALILVGRGWGQALMRDGHRITLFTPPVLGGYRVTAPTAVWIPVLVGAVAIAVVPVLAARLPWRSTLGLGAATALVWWLAVALVDGTNELTRGLFWPEDYAAVVPSVGRDPLGFLRGFVDANPSYGIAMRAHPPGLPLLFGVLDRIGLGGAGWAAAVILASAASAIPAVLIGVREIAGEATARLALPFLTIAPAAIWIVLSTDAFYLGPASWMVALFALASGRTGWRSTALAATAGLLGFVVAMLSYGLVLMAIPIAVVAVHRRAWRSLAIMSVVTGSLLLALVPFGYWYVAGYFATKHEYDTLGLDRPGGYFVVNNLAAFALVIGPAIAVALVRLRDRRLWVLVGGGVVAAVVADLSGLSKGEVERIWLPFSIWVLAAGAAFGPRLVAIRFWLGLQAVATVGILLFVRANW